MNEASWTIFHWNKKRRKNDHHRNRKTDHHRHVAQLVIHIKNSILVLPIFCNNELHQKHTIELAGET